MLFTVHGFLANKARYLSFQFGVGNLFAVVAHGVHEEGFAFREQGRQAQPESAQEGVVIVEIARRGLVVELEVQTTRGMFTVAPSGTFCAFC